MCEQKTQLPGTGEGVASSTDKTGWAEAEVKALLDKHGIAVPRGITITPEVPLDSAVKRCADLNKPLVVKLHDPAVVHKSDVGGVKLKLEDDTELGNALAELREQFADSELLVEEQAPDGVEFIIGLLRDPDFGLSIMAGFGGVLTELYEDVSFRVLPVTRTDCDDMLSELQAAPLLREYRGQKADREALIDVMLKLNDFTEEWGDRLEGVDLNPVLVHETGVTVVDAKMIVRGEK
jgi:succinyl-CoA synthetase beta subunit